MSTSIFETKPCSRCGGSGHYSYCPGYGTKCFKCFGRGWVHTKRGALASAYLSSLLRVPARLIEVGDLIYFEGFSCGSFSQPSEWKAVTEIRPGEVSRDGGAVINGVTIPPALVIVTEGHALHCSPETPVRRGADAATKRAARAKALYFQSTLNKKGEPMARPKEAA